MTVEHVYIALKRDDDGYPPFDVEELDARQGSKADEFVLERSPVFATGLAHGDTVKVVRVEGENRLWVTRVVDEGAGWNARIVPLDGGELSDVVAALPEGPHEVRSTQYGLVVVEGNGPADEDLLHALVTGFREGRWDYNHGVSPVGA